MSSILTNTSALSAVANLNATQKSLAATQNQISTGLKVSSAEDNAAYFSIANTLRTNVSNLSAVSDSLNLGKSVIGTANAAISGLRTTLTSISSQLVAAQQSGTSLDTIGTQITALQGQLTAAVSTASFNGVNLLDGTQANPLKFVSGVNGSGASTAVSYLSIDTSGTNLNTASGGGLNAASSFTVTGSSTQTDLAGFLSTVNAALQTVNTASSSLGAAASTIDQQLTFTSALSDSLTTGIGSLVDADLNQASTRLSALQTQQQLGVQSLSVANQNSQIILKLFQ